MRKHRHIVLFLFLTLLIASACFSSSTVAEKPATVEAPAGTYEGREHGATVSFKGIPFAAPIDGDRRWLAPAPVNVLDGDRGFLATQFGSPCPHLDELIPSDRKASDFVGGADCLNLNVWVPMVAFSERQNNKVPVMVFFHGGAFEVGSSAWSPWGIRFYDGAKLAATGQVIIVTFNYRVGVLGFFQHSVLNPSAVGANPGLLDQIAALQWVQKNIAAFGGDPANVTAFGESAGAMSICDLLTVPSAKGLIHKAILQSGSCIVASPEYAAETTTKVLTKLGCDGKSAEEQASCIRAKSDKEIVLAQPMATLAGGQITRLQFAPVVDGVTVQESPDRVIKSQRHQQIPILIGTNARETPAWMQPESKDSWEGIISKVTQSGPEGSATRLRELYEKQNRGNYKDLISEIKTDLSFTCRARYYAMLLAAHQSQPVFLYMFDRSIPYVGQYIGQWVHGSFHGMELFYLFQHLPHWLQRVTPRYQLQTDMAQLWTRFAATGKVEGEVNDAWQDWKPYGKNSRVAGVIGDFYGVLDDPRQEKCDLLETFMLKDGDMGILR